MRRRQAIAIVMLSACAASRGPREEVATFGAGCFWCAEAAFEQLEGVRDVVSGYMGGEPVDDPTPDALAAAGHAEVVQVRFDPSRTNYRRLLDVFWRIHDPTSIDRQGDDVGPEYRSVVFIHHQHQLVAFEASKIGQERLHSSTVVTYAPTRRRVPSSTAAPPGLVSHQQGRPPRARGDRAPAASRRAARLTRACLPVSQTDTMNHRKLVSPLAQSLVLVALGAPAAAQNDDCSGAVLVTSGTHPFSTIGATTSPPAWPCAAGGNDIWYRYVAPATGTVEVNLCGTGYDCAVQAFMGPCNALQPLACNDDTCGLQSVISFQGVTGQVYHIRVGGYSGSTGNGTMTINDAGPAPIGTNYCMAVPNSTGSPGGLVGFGLLGALDNDVTLTATDLPDGEFALFLTSQMQGFVPFPGGSVGNLCVLGNIGRFISLVSQTSGGQYSSQIDLTAIPQPPGPPVTVQPGETWYFQCWHRDMGPMGPVSNFTRGLALSFQ